MKKYLPYISSLAILLIGGIVYAAPSFQLFGNIGIATSTSDAFQIGSSTARFNRIYTNYASSTAISLSSGIATTTVSSASSTFANGITLTNGCLLFQGSCLISGGGLSIDWVKESNFGALTLTASTSIPYWAKQSIYASSTLITSDRVGIATSTSDRMLSVQGNALFSGDLLLANITASGTATTTNIRISDTLTIGGDNITDFVGTGLVLSGSTLTTSLGTSVDLGSSEVTGTLLVANGGTGSTTLGGILLGNGTSAVSATGTISVAWGGTGVGSFTLNSILVGNNNGALIASTSLGNDVISDGLTLTNITQITNRAITDLSGTLLVANGGTGSTTLGGILVGAGTSAVSATGTVAVSNGGTGATSFTLNSILVGNANGALIASTTLGDDVISDGLTLTNITQITNRAISDTTGTLLIARGGTASTTLADGRLLVGAGTSQMGATSTVSARWGGTGFSSYSAGDVLYADTANSLTRLAISGTAGQVLMVSGGVPIWAATSSAASDVTSVSANGTSLTISPTTGAVLAEINLANANTWTGPQVFNTTASTTRSAAFAITSGTVSIGTTTLLNGTTLLDDSTQILRLNSNPQAANRLVFSQGALAATSALWDWTIGMPNTTNTDFAIQQGNASTITDRFVMSSTTMTAGFSTSTPGASLSVHGNSLVSGTSTTANLVATGTIALASSTVQIHQYPSFTVATSTAWTGTTTKYLGIAMTPERWAGVRCMTDIGTLNVVFGDATTSPNAMNLLNASTTVGDFKIDTNNTFTVGEKRFVAIGTPASSPTVVSCTIDKVIN